MAAASTPLATLRVARHGAVGVLDVQRVAPLADQQRRLLRCQLTGDRARGCHHKPGAERQHQVVALLAGERHHHTGAGQVDRRLVDQLAALGAFAVGGEAVDLQGVGVDTTRGPRQLALRLPVDALHAHHAADPDWPIANKAVGRDDQLRRCSGDAGNGAVYEFRLHQPERVAVGGARNDGQVLTGRLHAGYSSCSDA
ncbi:hypothetical protein D9M69_296340 [compost metagenome]